MSASMDSILVQLTLATLHIDILFKLIWRDVEHTRYLSISVELRVISFVLTDVKSNDI